VKIIEEYKTDFKVVQITDSHVGEYYGDYMKDNFRDDYDLIYFACEKNGELLSECEKIKEWAEGGRSNSDFHSAIFSSVLNRISSIEKPEFIVHTGDVVDVGSSEISYEVVKKAIIDQLPSTPIYFTPGNHDEFETMDYFEEYLQPNMQILEPMFKDHNFYINYNEFRFIFFDSGPILFDEALNSCQKITNIDFINYLILLPYIKLAKLNGADLNIIMLQACLASTSYFGIYNPDDYLHQTGLNDETMNWIKDTYNINPIKSTFIFTHGPVASDEKKYTLIDNDQFVNWVNDPDPMGTPRYDNIKVEAVMNGHAHSSTTCYKITLYNRDACTNQNIVEFDYNPISDPFGTTYITSDALIGND